MGARTGEIETYKNIFEKELNRESTDDELAFWGFQPPDEVILATGSIRKALMLISQIEDFSFKFIENGNEIEITEIEELQRYFYENIQNGNGSLQQKTFLGYLFGVELYAEPGPGETSSNDDPYQEAINKAQSLYNGWKDHDDWADHEGYKGKNILIVSTDTVDKPDATDVPLGKPGNEFDFPKQEDPQFNHGILFDQNGYDKAKNEWLEAYKERFYVVSEAIKHTNAVAILNALTGDFIDTGFNIIELNIKIDHEKLKGLDPKSDEAGGGITQRLIKWEDMAEVMSYFGELTKSLLPEEVEKIKLALYCQITGSPYAIIELIRLAQQKIINENLEQ